MADQFCRIVDTTLTHTTLGADSAQTILTTDANTSYIIRDVFQKNSESNEKLKMTGSLVMNDVTVTGGITSSASGSLIVPPSTTLCYVDTSGNYPLDYQNVYMYPDVKAQCHNNCKLVVCTCTVNGVSSGSANVAPVNTTSYWGAVNSCNFYAGGFWLQDPDTVRRSRYRPHAGRPLLRLQCGGGSPRRCRSVAPAHRRGCRRCSGPADVRADRRVALCGSRCLARMRRERAPAL